APRRPAFDDAALLGRDHRFGKAVDGSIFGEEAVEHRAQKHDAVALEGLLVEQHGDLDPARGVEAVLLADAAHDRPRGYAVDAADAALRREIGKIGEKAEQLAQSAGTVLAVAIHEAEMVERQEVDELPCDLAGRRGRTLAPLQMDDGFAR